jgi:hypothetical protein
LGSNGPWCRGDGLQGEGGVRVGDDLQFRVIGRQERIWCEVDVRTGQPIEPQGLGLLGKTVILDGEPWVIVNTDALFPTDHVMAERAEGGPRRSLAVARARELVVEEGGDV